MPGFDGTGPSGMGPMTGGARGYCNPSGFRYGFPRRPGYAQPFFAASPYYPSPMPYDREQELAVLKRHADALKRTLEGIDGRISELSSEGK